MTEPIPNLPTRRRRGTAFWIRVGVTVALLAALFLWLPREDIVAAMRRVPVTLWLATVAFFLLGHTFSALKWRWLLIACGVRPTVREALQAHAAGLFGNLFLPSLVGGDVVRAGLATRAVGGLETVAVGTVADRGVDTASLLVLIAAAAPFLPQATEEATGRLLVSLGAGFLLAIVAAAGGVLLLLAPDRLPKLVREPARRVRTALGALVRHPGHAVAAVAVALAVQSAFVLLNVRLGEAVGITLPLAAWFFVWPLAKFAALVPVSLGGIGVREVALGALVAPFAVATGLAVGQALVWETVLVAGGLMAGGLSLWILPKRRSA